MPTTYPRQALHIARIRARLFEELGNACAECGETMPLQIDHPYGRDWTPRALSSYQRWRRYEKEHEEGLIRLLCEDCNKRIRPRRRPVEAQVDTSTTSTTPF